MRVRHLVLACAALAACRSAPPPRPLDQADVPDVYETALREMRIILVPRKNSPDTTQWEQHMYLNQVVLGPRIDVPVLHDRAWADKVTAAGLVRGYCGQPPADPCDPRGVRALISLGVPWTREGDTAVVDVGVVGELPDTPPSLGIFRTMLLRRDREEGIWKVFDRGQPQPVTFGQGEGN